MAALASNAYVLSDRGTWLAFQNRGDLATLLRATSVSLINTVSCWWHQREASMRALHIGAFGLLTVCVSLTPSLADTGFIRAVIAKSAFVIGVGQGTGTLAFRGRSYPLEISGIAFGAT